MQAAYMVFLTANAPKAIVDTWPSKHWRTLSENYSCAPVTPEMEEQVYDYEPEQEGNYPPIDVIEDTAVAKMLAKTPKLKFNTEHIREMLGRPKFNVFTGQQGTEEELIADAAELGITPIGVDLAAKKADAKAKVTAKLQGG